jgi:nucleotide-binding universal stress UspA family protein
MKHASLVEFNRDTATHEDSCELKTILAPIDFSSNSMLAFRYANRLAEKVGAKVIALNVVANPLVYPAFAPGDQELLAHEAQQRLYQACQANAIKPEDVETMVRMGVESIAEEIALAARDVAADLIVIPAHHRPLFGHTLLPNTADRIVRHAPCPVLMVPVPPSAALKSFSLAAPRPASTFSTV